MNSIRTQLANRSRPKALVTHLFWDRRAYLAIYAVAGFGVLNSSAKAAAPELTRIATSSPSFDVSDRAIGALDAIGKESLPALIQIIADTNQKVMSRKLAISHLAWMNLGSNALPAIQPLIRCLKDDDHIVAMRAAAAIGRLKLQPDASVAALMDALQDSRPWLRVPCIQALGEFGEQALRAEPLLKQALDDPNLQMRSAVTNALLKIAPEVIYRLSPGLDSHWHPQ